jgi:hypothetical protein
MSKFLTVLISLLLVSTSFGAVDESQRSLLKRSVYYVDTMGKVAKADYWSIPLGTFDFIVNRKYPGEGVVKVDGSANLAFISSGYIEGAGYGDRGKISVKAEFATKDADSLKIVELKDIDYVSMGGTEIKLKSGETKELFLMIEEKDNLKQSKGLGIMIWSFNKEWGELKHSKDIDRIIAFSFTADGAKRAYKAALAAANQ